MQLASLVSLHLPASYDVWPLARGALAPWSSESPSPVISPELPTPLASIRSPVFQKALSRALSVVLASRPRPTPRALPASRPAQARLLPPSRPPYPVQQPLGSGGERGRGPGRTRACPDECRCRSELPGSSGPAAPGTRVGGRRGARGDGVPGKERRSETHAPHSKVPTPESAGPSSGCARWGVGGNGFGAWPTRGTCKRTVPRCVPSSSEPFLCFEWPVN